MRLADSSRVEPVETSEILFPWTWTRLMRSASDVAIVDRTRLEAAPSTEQP